MRIFFFISYGELTLFKMKVDEISVESFYRMEKIINKMIDEKYDMLGKYVDNKFTKYERLLFDKVYKKSRR